MPYYPPAKSPGGTSGQVQWNNAGDFAGAAITTDGTGLLSATNWIITNAGGATFQDNVYCNAYLTLGTSVYDAGNNILLQPNSRTFYNSSGTTPILDFTGAGINYSAVLSFDGIDAWFTNNVKVNGSIYCSAVITNFTGTETFIDLGSRKLTDSSNYASINWQNHTMVDGTNLNSIDWSFGGRTLSDTSNIISVAWNTRQLLTQASVINIDWTGAFNGAAALSFDGSKNAKFSQSASVLDEVYSASWDGKTEVPTKNAIYDKIEALVASGTDLGVRRLLTMGY